jgi:hypothetical protein
MNSGTLTTAFSFSRDFLNVVSATFWGFLHHNSKRIQQQNKAGLLKIENWSVFPIMIQSDTISGSVVRNEMK